MLEDVAEIVLNVKQIVVSSDPTNPRPCTCATTARARSRRRASTRRRGSRSTTRTCIATVNDRGRLEIEFTVERGRGYIPAGSNVGADAPIGRIPVDSIYSPVLKVTCRVEATRVEQRTDFDKLIIDVETKSSLSARDAMASAGTTLVNLFGLARELNEEAEGIDIAPEIGDETEIARLNEAIEALELTVRSYNCLKREQINTVGELLTKSEADLLDIRNFGQKSIDEVKAKLAQRGLSLKDSPPGFDPIAVVTFSGADDEAFPEDEQY